MWNNWGASDHTPFISYDTILDQPIKCTSFILLYIDTFDVIVMVSGNEIKGRGFSA